MSDDNLGHDESDSFDVRSTDDEEEDDDILEIELSSNIFEIRYTQIIKYSKLIQQKYSVSKARSELSELIQEYAKNYNIQDKNIIIFFKFLQDKSVEIDSSSYFDLYKLALLLEVTRFNKVFHKFEKNNSEDVSFLINLLLNAKTIEKIDETYDDNKINEAETKLSSQINLCIQNDEFNKLPFLTIKKIIEKSDKNTIDSNYLLQFIMKSIEDRHLLLPLVKIEQLSGENISKITDIIYAEEEDSPIQEYFKDFEDSLQNYQMLNEYKDKQESKKQIILNKKDKLIDKVNKLKDRVNELEKTNKELENDTLSLREENAKVIDKNLHIEKVTSGKENIIKQKENLFKIVNKFVYNIEDLSKVDIKGIFFYDFNKTILHKACELGNIELVKYILSMDEIDITTKSIFKLNFFL